MFRKTLSSFDDLNLKQGFGTKRIEPSPFITIDGYDQWWRDVTTRSAMEDRFSSFTQPIHHDVDEKVFQQAVFNILELFRTHYHEKLFPISINDAIGKLPTDTSAGLPFSPGTKKGQVQRELRQLATFSWKRLSTHRYLPVVPCKAGARKQLRPVGTNKPRLVFAYPGYLNVLETQFSAPFLDAPPPFIAWSLNWLDYGLSVDRVKSRFVQSNGWANLDFSSFDSTVSAKLIKAAFDILHELLELNSLEREMLYELEFYFIHTPLVMYNIVRYKHRGIPSGSGFTQLIGSIVNAIACQYASLRSREFSLDLQKCIWLGDDSFLSFTSGLSKLDFGDQFLKHFSELGLNVNFEKTEYCVPKPKAEAVFLSKRFVAGTRALKPDLSKLAGQICWPENKDKSPNDTIQRLIGLAWACGYSEDAYRILLRAYVDVTKKWKVRRHDVKLSPALRRMFLLTELSEEDLAHFPNLKEIEKRYYGWYSDIGRLVQ